ncbi:MAG: CPBP family intramembrane metalloprotease [Gammaproteobacteria bacterium]|nr:CPBP family intramembrane metalloprotease [Gammaproteobacteria bacterium]
MIEQQKPLSAIASLLFVGGYFGLTFARSAGWIPESWSLIPVVETAWLNFLVVLAAMIWMRIEKIPLSCVGLGAFQPSRTLLMWVVGTMAVDSVAVGIAAPVLTSAFGEAPQVARFADLPGNLPLLLMLLPVTWLIGAFGEEFFFRGFLMAAIAEVLGGSRAAWISAVVAQAVAFGLIHAYQGPAQAISIGIGGAVYGAAFLLARGNLWPLILAHGINDTLGFIFLYSGAIQR